MKILEKIKALLPTKAVPIPVVYPYIQIQSDTQSSFCEHHHAPDFVFSGNDLHKLAEYGSHAQRMVLYFRAKNDGANDGVENVAAFLMRENDSFTYAYELPELSARANYRQISALAQYVFLRDKLHAGSHAGHSLMGGVSAGMPGWAVGLLIFMGLLSAILLFSPPAQPLHTPLALSQPQSATPAPLLSSGDQLTEDEKLTLIRVVKASGIELSSGEKPFVIFSDPNCPACRELEVKLTELSKTDKTLSPVVVPVAFKKDSREAVAGILCANDVSAAWHAAASGERLAPVCSKGNAQADINNATFVGLRFDRTPTIVTSNGKVAVGAKDFDALIRWIKSNSTP